MKRKKPWQPEKKLKQSFFCPWCGQKVSCVTEVFTVRVYYVTSDGDPIYGGHGECLMPRQEADPEFSGIELWCNDCRKGIVLKGVPSLSAITEGGQG